MAGYPIRVLPDLVLPGMPDWAPIVTRSPTLICPATPTYLGGTRHASLRSHHRVASYLYIVGNLNQVVQLYTLMDDGGAHRGTVYARIGTDFHIVFDNDDTDLGNLVIAFGGGGKPESVRPMTHPACRMQLFPTRQS